MTLVGGWLYAGIFAGALALALGLTPLVLHFAHRHHILDEPGGHKSHVDAVPYLGGVAIAVAFAAAIMAAVAIRQPPSGLVEIGTILGMAVLLSLVGLVDDLRGGLGVTIRLGAQILAGALLWLSGAGISLFADLGVLNAVLTVLWVVGITNAFNLLDNMDGLSSGVAAIASLWFFIIAALNGQYLVAALAIALCGVSLGFLKHNFPPARIYMGDAGSLFLGFLLAALGIKLRFEGPTQITFFVPILVLGVAIFDTTLVVITRLAHGRSPLSGGRDHVSHRLVMVGIPVHAAVALIYGGAVALGWLAVVMSRIDRVSGFILMGFCLAVAAFLGVLLGNVPVYENSKRRRLMIQEVVDHEPTGEIAVQRSDEVSV